MKTKIKKIIKKIIASFFWHKNDSLELIFKDELYFQNKISKLNYFLIKNKRIFSIILLYLPKSPSNINDLVINYLNNSHPLQTEETKISILRIIYELKCCDNLLLQKTFEYAEKTPNKIYRYWAVLFVDVFAFWRTLKLPENFYKSRKKLIEQIALENKFILPKKNDIRRNNKKRLCIITYLMADTLKNSSQRVLKMIVDNIDDSYFDIDILCINSFYYKNYNPLIITNWNNSIKYKYSAAKLIAKRVNYYYAINENPLKRIQESLDIINTINPDIIIDMTDEYSVASYNYTQNYPTLYSPLRGNISASYFTHYRASVVNETKKQNIFYQNVLDKARIIEWNFPEYIAKPQNKFSRQQFNLKEDTFIIATAGIIPLHDILFFNTMLSILKDNDNYMWIAIGSSFPKEFYEQNKSLFSARRIIDWGYENDLPALYEICNVFIQPDKTGGSGTVAIAAQQKLPILITNFPSDALRWIGEENTIKGGYEGYKKEIEKLCNDSSYYSKKSNLFYSLVSKASDSKDKWDQFNQILKGMI